MLFRSDIEIRHAQKLVRAIEVSAASWDTKLPQVEAAAKAGLSATTIAALNIPTHSRDLVKSVASASEMFGLDVAVVDLHSYMDLLASQLTPHHRASAFRYVYTCLRRWHRRTPALAKRLVEMLSDLDLTSNEIPRPNGVLSRSPAEEILVEALGRLRRDGLFSDPRSRAAGDLLEELIAKI